MSGLQTVKLTLGGSPITLISVDSKLIEECERVLEKHFSRKSPAFSEADGDELPEALGPFQIAVDLNSSIPPPDDYVPPSSRYYPLEIETHADVFTDEIDKAKFSPPTPESRTVFAPVIAEVRSLHPADRDGWWPNRGSNQDVAWVEPIPGLPATNIKSEPQDWYGTHDADVYNCVGCGMVVANSNRIKHDVKCGTYECLECGWHFKNLSALSAHKRDHRYNKRRRKHLNQRWRQKDCKTSPVKQKPPKKRKQHAKGKPLTRLAATLRSQDAPPLLMPFDTDPAIDPAFEGLTTSRRSRPCTRPRDPLNVPAVPAALPVSPRRRKPFISLLSDKRFASVTKADELSGQQPVLPPKQPEPGQPPRHPTKNKNSVKPGRRTKRDAVKRQTNGIAEFAPVSTNSSVLNKISSEAVNVSANKVSANKILAGKIVGSTAVTSKVLPNKVLASKIVGSTAVTSNVLPNKILTSKVVGSKVVGIKVSTSKVVGSKISTSKVVGSKVSTSKVVGSKVSTSKVLGSKVSTSKISGNKMLARKVVANGSHRRHRRSRCSKCPATFLNGDQLEEHMVVHRILCPHCTRYFDNQVYLVMHVKVFHPEIVTDHDIVLPEAAVEQPDGELPAEDSALGNDPFDVDRLYSQSEGSGSERSRSPGYHPYRQVPKKRVHACTVCPMRCASARLLRRHLLGHAVPDRIECPTCNRLFRNQSTLAAHFEKMHGVEIVRDDIDEGPLQCKGCDALLVSRMRLAEHYCTSHINLALLGCGICRHVLSLTQWRTHAATHM